MRISSSHFRVRGVNCLQSPPSRGAPEHGWASPPPAQHISHRLVQSLGNQRAEASSEVKFAVKWQLKTWVVSGLTKAY